MTARVVHTLSKGGRSAAIFSPPSRTSGSLWPPESPSPSHFHQSTPCDVPCDSPNQATITFPGFQTPAATPWAHHLLWQPIAPKYNSQLERSHEGTPQLLSLLGCTPKTSVTRPHYYVIFLPSYQMVTFSIIFLLLLYFYFILSVTSL